MTLRRITLAYWIFTTIFVLQMGFTAYAQLCLPQVAQVFAHLGFPNYFRIELTWVKLVGVAVLLLPSPARLKEWAYAGFAITLSSALIAHLAVGDGFREWIWSVGTAILGALSYYFHRKREAIRDSQEGFPSRGVGESAHERSELSFPQLA